LEPWARLRSGDGIDKRTDEFEARNLGCAIRVTVGAIHETVRQSIPGFGRAAVADMAVIGVRIAIHRAERRSVSGSGWVAIHGTPILHTTADHHVRRAH
jgi:hypothetical protein